MMRTWQYRLAIACCALSVGCGGEAGGRNDEARAANDGTTGGKDLNACHLLSHQEVSALVERPITMRDQTEATPRYSTCEYSDSSGQFAFGLTVYWSGGKEEWETWRMAQGLGQQIFAKTEGVEVDSVVRQGPVSGLGDGAYFSELLPSLVLAGDVLVEMKMNFVQRAETRFRPLAQKLLSRL